MYCRYICILVIFIQWNLSNPTHEGTEEMCRIVQDVGMLRFILVRFMLENSGVGLLKFHCIFVMIVRYCSNMYFVVILGKFQASKSNRTHR